MIDSQPAESVREWLWEAHFLDAVLQRPDPVMDQTDFQPSGEPIFKLHYLEMGEGDFVRMDDCRGREGAELFKREMRTTELVNIRDGHWAKFPQVDFATGRDFLRVCANVLVGGYIDLHVDGLDGEAVACLLVGTTEKREITSTFEVPMAEQVTGVHAVYLRFREAPVPPCPAQSGHLGATGRGGHLRTGICAAGRNAVPHEPRLFWQRT